MLIIKAVIERPIAPLSSLRFGIDRELEEICLRCLEKDPGDRFLSAAALGDALEQWLDRPLAAPVRGARRDRSRVLLVAGGVVLLAAGTLALALNASVEGPDLRAGVDPPVAVFTRILSWGDRSWQVYFNLAQAQRSAGRNLEAIETHERAHQAGLAAGTPAPWPRTRQAELLVGEGRLEEAERGLAEVRALFPGVLAWRVPLSMLRYEQGRFEEARTLAAKVWVEGQSHERRQVVTSYVAALMRLGERAEARRVLGEVPEVENENLRGFREELERDH